MDPIQEKMHLPPGYTIARRPSCQPAYQPAAVRDREGRVLAQADVLRPDQLPN